MSREPVWRNLDRIRAALQAGGVLRYSASGNHTIRLYDADNHRLCQVAWPAYVALRRELVGTPIRSHAYEYRLKESS